MREYWGMSLRFMLVVGLVCASSVAHADFVRMQMDDEYQGVTVRLTDFAELQPYLADPGLPPRPQADPFYDPRSPGSWLDSWLMPTWDTYAASYSGSDISDIPVMSLLADAPAMFGHFYGGGMTLTSRFIDCMGSEATAVTDVPLAGRSRRTHVGENNKALTHDRVYLRYNHYHRASTASVDCPFYGSTRRDFHLDSYTLAAEKTFGDGIWSLEARMPFAGQMDFSDSLLSVHGERVGNLALILKRMLHLSEHTSVVGGLGIDVPTGSSVKGEAFWIDYKVKNDAIHLLPYMGFLGAWDNRYFANGFVQFDVPVNGQRVSIDDYFIGEVELGKFHEQTLLHLDVSVGRWLQRNPDAPLLTGLAFLTELHYTTALNNADHLFWYGFFMDPDLHFHNPGNQVSLLNLTIGLHSEWRNNTSLRIGSVFPLRTGTDRTFDAELQVQLERRF